MCVLFLNVLIIDLCNTSPNLFFEIFSFLIAPLDVLSRNDKSLWNSGSFSKYWVSTSTKYPLSLSSLQFFFNFLLHHKYMRSTQSYLWEALSKLPYHIKYLDPNMKIWRFFIFIALFPVFVIGFCIPINRVTYYYSNTFFYH